MSLGFLSDIGAKLRWPNMSWEEEEMSGSLGPFGMKCVQHQLEMMSPVENFIRE